jgi:hypothetical protein
MAFLTCGTFSPSIRRSFGSKAAAASGDSSSTPISACGTSVRAGMKQTTTRDSPSASALSETNV